jgi:hypothetical protein
MTSFSFQNAKLNALAGEADRFVHLKVGLYTSRMVKCLHGAFNAEINCTGLSNTLKQHFASALGALLAFFNEFTEHLEGIQTCITHELESDAFTSANDGSFSAHSIKSNRDLERIA